MLPAATRPLLRARNALTSAAPKRPKNTRSARSAIRRKRRRINNLLSPLGSRLTPDDVSRFFFLFHLQFCPQHFHYYHTPAVRSVFSITTLPCRWIQQRSSHHSPSPIFFGKGSENERGAQTENLPD